jgi:hypothetical protein
METSEEALRRVLHAMNLAALDDPGRALHEELASRT